MLQSDIDGIYGGQIATFIVDRKRCRDTRALVGEKHINIAPEELSCPGGALIPNAIPGIIGVGGIPIGSDNLATRIPANPTRLDSVTASVHVFRMNRTVRHLLQHQKIALGVGEIEHGELRIALEDVHRERLDQALALALIHQRSVFQHLLGKLDHHRRRLEKVHHLADDAPMQLLQQVVGKDSRIRPVRVVQIDADPRDGGKQDQQGDYGNRDPEESPQAPAALGPQIQREVETVSGGAHPLAPSG